MTWLEDIKSYENLINFLAQRSFTMKQKMLKIYRLKARRRTKGCVFSKELLYHPLSGFCRWC
jgi:hypothetical protein